jgi:alpha 1,2-mannosyltransferase
VVSGEALFGQIPREHWVQPDWIDESKASEARKTMAADSVPYGGSLPYRNMCRFNSGFFYRQELMLNYDYYWRVEPDVHFHCDIPYDPFVFMRDNQKVYGFTISMHEYEVTIPTLWRTVKEFMETYPEHVANNNAMGFVSNDRGNSYNRCHCTFTPLFSFHPRSHSRQTVWSNFEIADLNFWRSPAYADFFSFLDSKGGFYYERWGDAPVHSIAAALLAPKDKLHFFEDIGYSHNPWTHCPSPNMTVEIMGAAGEGLERTDAWTRGRCSCSPEDSFGKRFCK